MRRATATGAVVAQLSGSSGDLNYRFTLPRLASHDGRDQARPKLARLSSFTPAVSREGPAMRPRYQRCQLSRQLSARGLIILFRNAFAAASASGSTGLSWTGARLRE